MLLSPALIYAAMLVGFGYLSGWHQERTLFVSRLCSVLFAVALIPQFVLHARYFLHNRGKTFWSDSTTLWIAPADGPDGGPGTSELNRSTVEKVQWVARFQLFWSYPKPLNRYYYWRVTLRDGRVTVVNSLVHAQLFALLSSKSVIQETKWSLFPWY